MLDLNILSMQEHLSFIGIGLWEISLIFFLAVPFLLMIWAIIDLTKREFKDSTNKIIWALAVIFIPFFGALVYLIFGTQQSIDSKT